VRRGCMAFAVSLDVINAFNSIHTAGCGPGLPLGPLYRLRRAGREDNGKGGVSWCPARFGNGPVAVGHRVRHGISGTDSP
jgi:hypothetical protein